MGGKAVKNVGRIYKEEMIPTYEILKEHLYQVLGLDSIHFITCGSFFIRESCGDIDIAFDVNAAMKIMNMTRNEITNHLQKLYSTLPDYKYNKGFDIHSIPFPIFDKNGNRTDRYVQVDLIPVECIEMAQWGMLTCTKTPWKSATRNALLRAVAKYKNIVAHSNENGTVLNFERLYYDKVNGLFKMVRSYVGKNGYILKNPKTISKELITNNPNEIVELLFDRKDLSPFNNVRNVDDVWNLIKNYDNLFPIVHDFIEEMEREDIDYPHYIKDYWSEQMEDGENCK